MSLPPIDIIIVVAYNIGIVLFGCWFLRRNHTADHFMAAGRSLPGWAVGLSIFGSYVSSISFLALPGKAFGGNWNPFVFSLALPIAAIIAVRFFVPFYRKAGHVSAYQHLEHRFGPWARTYAVACYLLIQLTRTAVVMYLLSLALASLLGWDLSAGTSNLRLLIILIGVAMLLYPLLGGTEAVIWTGVVQSLILVLGAVVSLVCLLLAMPQGPGQVLHIAQQHDKFSLGSFALSFAEPTFWVVLLYGLAENLRNFGITQSYVQGYITAKSDRAAQNSVWLAALLYVPLSAVFFLIGTALFAYYAVRPELLPATLAAEPDKVFPYYIRTQLPPGIMGLIVAAICAAATDSNYNSMATLIHCDIYRRYFRPQASERESMWVLRLSTLGCGLLSILVAMAMINSKSILDAWWTLAGIFSGGMLGLFLLGMISRRATSAAAAVGLMAGILVILWMTASLPSFAQVAGDWRWPASLARLRSPVDAFLIPVIGTLTVLLVGLMISLWTGPRARQPKELEAVS